jgi:undecaprenyl-diphosphatase
MKTFIPDALLRRRLTVAVITGLCVLALGMILRHSSFDLPVTRSLNSVHLRPVAAVTDLVYGVFEPKGAALVVLVTAGVVGYMRRNWRPAAVFAATVAISWLAVAVVKLLVERPRLDSGQLHYPMAHFPTDPSFPSGHTAFATAYAVALVLFAASTERGRQRAFMIGAALVVVVALSVLIDGVHYPTDVLASLVYGLAVTPAVGHLMRAFLIGSRALEPSR